MIKIALLDAGAQLEKVIMRRIIECGYSVDKFAVDTSADQLSVYDAIIISGGPRSVNASGALLPDKSIYSLGKPILGICYGMQAIAHQLGGQVVKGQIGQYGRHHVAISNHSGIFHGLSSKERVLMSHFDSVSSLPNGFQVYANCDGQIAAIGDPEKRIYAMQFHPELTPVTKNGEAMFRNFFHEVCSFPDQQRRQTGDEITHSRHLIQQALGSDRHVMQYMSGGVDSTVMTLLLMQSIEPARLHVRLLDTGTMRKDEVGQVVQMAHRLRMPDFKVLDVRQRFYETMREIKVGENHVLRGPLCYEINPEVKRKLFGTEYAVIALSEMSHISRQHSISIEDILLGQGTLRPDLIESGDSRVTKGEAHAIKTHHNAVDALKNISKVEPLVELFKDQVRQIALSLGLPEAFAFRQPFPGPGLYCRIVGYDGARSDADLLGLDKVVQAASNGLNVHPMPFKTVGVQGDERSYKHAVIVSGDVDWKEFAALSLRLPNEINQINRVMYAFGEPIVYDEATSMTRTLMTHDVIDQVKQADAVMREIAGQYGFNDSRRCSQLPGSIIPVDLGHNGKRCFVVRPVFTTDFMANIGMMPEFTGMEFPEEHFPIEMLKQMAEEIPRRVDGIARVLLDSSDKPPASTELE